MKKLLIIAALAVFAAAGTASAQNYMVVNTETIFKSMTAYNQAVEEMDAAAQQYQQNIDNAYAELEDMYETYMSQKASLSQSARQQREETILNNEKKIAEYQASIFGEDGKMQTGFQNVNGSTATLVVPFSISYSSSARALG